MSETEKEIEVEKRSPAELKYCSPIMMTYSELPQMFNSDEFMDRLQNVVVEKIKDDQK